MLTPHTERVLKAAQELLNLLKITDVKDIQDHVVPEIADAACILQAAVIGYRREAAGIILNKAKSGSKL